MLIAILHNAVAGDDSPEDQDTLTQAAAVSQALCRLGHEPVTVPCTLDLAAVRESLLQFSPDLVVNLVESLAGNDSLAHLVSALLDVLGLPYTGSHTEALFTTNHKLIAKQTMRQAGLPTPDWLVARDGVGWTSESVSKTAGWASQSNQFSATDSEVHPTLQPPCIIKSVWEHGSRGLDDENVIPEGDTSLVRDRLEEFVARTGRPHFAEQFIDGREFNVPLLDGPGGPQVLPPAEIDFSAFPADKPRIVGHRNGTKARSSTTIRRGALAPASMTVRWPSRSGSWPWNVGGCFSATCRLFRVDRAGQPWILEINANPCLSPDAGFAAALAEAGVSYDEAIQRIVDSAVAGRDSRRPEQACAVPA